MVMTTFKLNTQLLILRLQKIKYSFFNNPITSFETLLKIGNPLSEL